MHYLFSISILYESYNFTTDLLFPLIQSSNPSVKTKSQTSLYYITRYLLVHVVYIISLGTYLYM